MGMERLAHDSFRVTCDGWKTEDDMCGAVLSHKDGQERRYKTSEEAMVDARERGFFCSWSDKTQWMYCYDCVELIHRDAYRAYEKRKAAVRQKRVDAGEEVCEQCGEFKDHEDHKDCERDDGSGE